MARRHLRSRFDGHRSRIALVLQHRDQRTPRFLTRLDDVRETRHLRRPEMTMRPISVKRDVRGVADIGELEQIVHGALLAVLSHVAAEMRSEGATEGEVQAYCEEIAPCLKDEAARSVVEAVAWAKGATPVSAPPRLQ